MTKTRITFYGDNNCEPPKPIQWPGDRVPGYVLQLNDDNIPVWAPLGNFEQGYFGDGSIDDVIETAISGQTPLWLDIPAPAVGAALNGAVINANDKIIQVAANQTGIGTYLRSSFNLEPFTDLAFNETFEIRAIHAEVTENDIQITNFLPVVKNNGVELDVEVEVRRIAPRLLEYKFTGKRALINNYEIQFTRGSGTIAVSTQTVSTWQSLEIRYRGVKRKQFRELLDKTARKAAYANDYANNSHIMSTCVANGYDDNTDQLQYEIDLATTTGKNLYLKSGKYVITRSLYIRGAVKIYGLNWDRTEINTQFTGTAFLIETNESWVLADFEISRINTVTPKGIDFLPTFTTVGARVERVYFNNVIEGMLIDYTENLTVIDCKFSGVNKPIVVGEKSNVSNKRLKIIDPIFIDCSLTVVYIYGFHDLWLQGSFFTSNGQFYSNTNIQVDLQSGVHEGLYILDNRSDNFRQYGIIITANNPDTRGKRIRVQYNDMEDKSTATGSSPLAIACDSGQLSDVDVVLNSVNNKALGMYFKQVVGLNMNTNKIVGTGIAPSKGFQILSCDYREENNTVVNQFSPSDYPSSTQTVGHDRAFLPTFTPGTIAAGGQVSTNINVGKARPGHYVVASFSTNLGGLSMFAQVISNGVVRVTFSNPTSAPITVGAGVLFARII